MNPISRKNFIELFSKGVGCFTIAATLPFRASLSKIGNQQGRYSFPQGVASGDPTESSVVLWTRVEATDGNTNDVEVVCQVSKTERFDEVIAERELVASSASDHTVRVIVHDLEPNSKYFYRFIAGDDVTDLMGHTRTTPTAEDAQNINFAFASCQSYEGGYYGAYRALINQDKEAAAGEEIHFVLHLGDFIYETLGYGSARKLPPFPSGGASTGEDVDWSNTYAVTLDDYRHLYKNYIADPDLKEARARWPFMCIWDDHEFTDDSWQGVSTYQIPDKPDQERKYVANQAWFEYIPAYLTGNPGSSGIESGAFDFKETEVETAPLQGFDEEGINTEPNNIAAIDSLKIYRSARWGKNLELVLTDSRSYRTPHAIPGEINNQIAGSARYMSPLPLVQVFDAGKEFDGGNPPDEIPIGAGNTIPNTRKNFPAGSLLGKEQKHWWKEVIGKSNANWKFWGHSVPVMPMRLDLDKVNPQATTTVFTIDTWDGYHTERKELMGFVKENQINNFVSLAGDNHNSFAGVLDSNYEDDQIESIGAEFCVCGISSTSVFKALVNYVPEGEPMRPLITYDATNFGGSEKTVPSLNMTFMHGAMASATMAQTGNMNAAMAQKNPSQNPHLRMVDSSANGIAIVRVREANISTEFITIEEPVFDRGEAGATILRRSRFNLPAWKKGEDADLQGPEFIGTPPFPFS